LNDGPVQIETESRDRLLASREFHQLVARRWRMSLVLTFLLFVLYYGYVILIAVNKPLLASRYGGGVTPLGIPLGAAVIIGSWILTAVYIVWANRNYDPEVARLRDSLTRRG
jgi:uncharacterized membrane protein (DUF485 family)